MIKFFRKIRQNLLMENKTGNEEFKDLPAWSSKMEICGEVALISSKRASETTLFLEPRTYILEC